MENNYLFDQLSFTDLINAFVSKVGKRTLVVGVGVLVLVFYLLYKTQWPGVHAETTFDIQSDLNSESQEQNDSDMITVDLSGGVMNPGMYKLPVNSYVADVIRAGGGFSNDVSARWASQKLNLAEKLKDSQKIYVPFAWEMGLGSEIAFSLPLLLENGLPQPQDTSDSSLGNGIVLGDSPTDDIDDPSTSTLVNVNSADQIALEALPGIGKVYAQKIIDNRPYIDLESFKTKSGLSEGVIEKITNLITF